MKPIIIRKPKFMRNDKAMWLQLSIATSIMEVACKPDVTPEHQVDLLKKAGKCLNDAAKAGGFFNVSDMHKWLTTHK